MKADNGVIQYKSRQDYLSRAGKKASAPVKGLGKTAASSEQAGAGAKALPEDKVSVSEEAKEKAKMLKDAPAKIEDKAKETVSAGKKLASEATTSLKKALKTPGLTNLLPDLGGDDKPAEVKKTEEKRESKTINTPGIFFMKGFSLNPFASDAYGLTGMSENIPTAKVFNWDEESNVIDQIKRRPVNQPIVLVGHGMGADSIVNIANQLNTMEHGFRKIDLLVTLDAIGFDNDIIPQNVKENMNMISDQDIFFNDGPNIARDKTRTNVTNELRIESHSEMDKSPEVQFAVFEKINSVLSDAVVARNAEKVRLAKLSPEIENLKS